jgi:hypothetical protein
MLANMILKKKRKNADFIGIVRSIPYINHLHLLFDEKHLIKNSHRFRLITSSHSGSDRFNPTNKKREKREKNYQKIRFQNTKIETNF